MPKNAKSNVPEGVKRLIGDRISFKLEFGNHSIIFNGCLCENSE